MYSSFYFFFITLLLLFLNFFINPPPFAFLCCLCLLPNTFTIAAEACFDIVIPCTCPVSLKGNIAFPPSGSNNCNFVVFGLFFAFRVLSKTFLALDDIFLNFVFKCQSILVSNMYLIPRIKMSTRSPTSSALHFMHPF